MQERGGSLMQLHPSKPMVLLFSPNITSYQACAAKTMAMSAA